MGEPGGTQQPRQPPSAVRFLVDVGGDATEDAIGQLAIGVRHGQGAEVLVLKADHPAPARHAHHLVHHRQRIGDVEHDGDGDRRIEPCRLERQAGGVADTEGDRRMRAAQLPRRGDDAATPIDADDPTARAHERRQVAEHDAGAAADLEHAAGLRDSREPEKASPEPRLRARASALLE